MDYNREALSFCVCIEDMSSEDLQTVNQWSQATFQHFLDAVSFNDIIVQGSKITASCAKKTGMFFRGDLCAI